MERRAFLKSSCSLCVGIALGSLQSCAPLPVFETSASGNEIGVPIALFANKELVIVRADNLPYDIAVRKKIDGSYLALLLRCTHSDNPLSFTGRGFRCSLHGSTFDEAGAATRGPAQASLKRLKTKLISDNIAIQLI